MQTTLKRAVTFTGIGLHSGETVTMTVAPAPVDFGIWFNRVDLGDKGLIPALWNAVGEARLCTKISNEHGAIVGTIEHIMAAIAGCGIQNALIDIDGPEVPVMDGSSAEFVTEFLAAGLIKEDGAQYAIEVLKSVEVQTGDAIARLSPAANLEIDFHIDFTDAAIGRQDKVLNMANGTFVRELCDSRTFCRQRDVDAMRANGLALGGSTDNAVVVEGADVLTPGGLRHRDEAVRHKMLDALGDLALAGAPILGRYEGHRAGHALTNKLLRALFADDTAYRIVKCDDTQASRLPGVGVHAGDLPQLA